MESCSLVSREAFWLIGQKCRLLEELDLTDNEIDDEGSLFSSDQFLEPWFLDYTLSC
jgi:hypothetical protein